MVKTRVKRGETRVEIVLGSGENTCKNWCKSCCLEHGVNWSLKNTCFFGVKTGVKLV